MKKTLHIQLERYNGIRYDFIEVEIENLNEIKGIYEELDTLFPASERPAPKAFNNVSGNGDLATPGQKKYMTSLKIAFDDTTTKQQAIKLIEAKVNKPKPASAGLPWDIEIG